jgi:hypothetical protein
MLRAFLVYLAAVLFFGTLQAFGLANSAPDGSKGMAAVSGYVFVALIWGGVFFNSVIRHVNAPSQIKTILTFVLAFAAGAVAFFFYRNLGGEAAENLRMGVGRDVTQYREYPIKGYQLIGLLIVFLYLVMAFCGWFFALSDKAIAEKKRLEAKRNDSFAE